MTPDELAGRFEHAAMKLGPAIQKGVKHTATLGAARVRGNASGRPGPNVISGDYRDSWQPAPLRMMPYGASCTIGTRLPYGRRLEYGFTGTDSLGRSYDQPPFPHVEPAIDYIGTVLMGQMRLAVAEVLL